MKKAKMILVEDPLIQKRKKVAAYARVSLETDRLANSLSAQISYYTTLIHNNPDWEAAGIYADRFVSGTEMSNRPQLGQLLDDCEKGLIDLVLCKSISRLSRNTVDLLNIIRHLKEINVEVYFEKENISTMSGEGEMMLSILAGFAQEESRSVSENIKWSIRKGYEKGKARYTLCYGYRIVNGIPEIDRQQASVVRQIFRWYLEGDSCYAIKNKLNAAGIPSYYGKSFTAAVISNMLRQEKYMGNTLMQKYYTSDHITHKELKNKGELPMFMGENTHEAIISPEIFHAVQAEIAHRSGVPIINSIAAKDPYFYRPRGSKADKPTHPRRKTVLSPEKRYAMSQYFSDRNS